MEKEKNNKICTIELLSILKVKMREIFLFKKSFNYRMYLTFKHFYLYNFIILKLPFIFMYVKMFLLKEKEIRVGKHI